MKLAPGTPLAIGLLTDQNAPALSVGRLAMAAGLAQLEWSADVIAQGLSISPLRYPAEPGLHPARSRTFDGLHGFLSDCLPDAWGMLLLKRRVQQLGHRFEALDAVDRLALVGTKGRGALVFQPETLTGEPADSIDLDLLADEARHVLLGKESELDDLLARLGGGSGGARPKVHVAIGAGGSLSAGDELAVTRIGSASEEWIVKFAATNDPADIGPLEEAYARMARAAQIDMAETRLIPSATGPGHFATRRFDRPAPGKRLHMVSLGGALEASPHMPSVDYDGFLKATLAITHSMADVEHAFRRMIFNVLARNRDDHVRQHAYLMDDRGNWRLAPAFDLTFSNGPGGEHYMAVLGEGRAITREHVEKLGKNHGVPAKRVGAAIDDVRAALADWPSYARDAGVGVSMDTVSECLASVARIFG
ncbi:phosphatidylinositol kinase [Novosphingobium sp. AAP83]|uniref:type II toxin-antitoxin system HipA family toxin n=1 Tax=Novosphingobium sp. AAP83 TaxID=1523425 RepID=UPI0006B9FBF3|nr:type II toxin-antitoxin system HipA family toxin [Novosphingobium sp. AAP83]KPF93418.1 phosphatidylinositol kinase [Novosphingobium sp. AAP83]